MKVARVLMWTGLGALLGLAAFDELSARVTRPMLEAAGLSFATGLLLSKAPAFVRRSLTAGTPPDALPWWTWALPAATGLLSYGWAVTLGPLSDDYTLHQWAAEGRLLPSDWPFLRPLPLAIWQGLTDAGGGWKVLHGLNILGHSCNSALVAVIGATLLRPAAGVAAGVLFAMFPASAEVAAWTAGVFDVLATACTLTAVAAALRMAASRRRTVVIVASVAAGVLCKESAVVAPLLVVLALAARGQSHAKWRQHGPELGVSFLVCAAVAAARLSSEHLQNLPHGRRGWKDLLLRPFAAAAVPARQEEALVATLMAVIALALAAMALWSPPATRDDVFRSAPRQVGFAGLLWTLVAALPLLSQFEVTGEMQGGRYLYLPFAGFAVSLASSLTRRGRAAWTSYALIGVLTGTFMWRVDVERRIWQQAAGTRDSVLEQAQSLVDASRCHVLAIDDAPDHHKGAYVFREGLAAALDSLRTHPNGPQCLARWHGGTLQFGAAAP